MYNLTFLTNGTLDGAYVGIASNIPELMNLILLFIFFVIFGGGSYASKRIFGGANMAMWGTVAGFATTLSAFILYLVPGLLSLDSVIVCLVITLGFGLWFLFVGADDAYSIG